MSCETILAQTFPKFACMEIQKLFHLKFRRLIFSGLWHFESFFQQMHVLWSDREDRMCDMLTSLCCNLLATLANCHPLCTFGFALQFQHYLAKRCCKASSSIHLRNMILTFLLYRSSFSAALLGLFKIKSHLEDSLGHCWSLCIKKQSSAQMQKFLIFYLVLDWLNVSFRGVDVGTYFLADVSIFPPLFNMVWWFLAKTSMSVAKSSYSRLNQLAAMIA